MPSTYEIPQGCNLDRIIQYTKQPSLENIKKANRTSRAFNYEKNKFAFRNVIKTMKNDVRKIDTRMSEIAR